MVLLNYTTQKTWKTWFSVSQHPTHPAEKTTSFSWPALWKIRSLLTWMRPAIPYTMPFAKLEFPTTKSGWLGNPSKIHLEYRSNPVLHILCHIPRKIYLHLSILRKETPICYVLPT